MPSKYIKKPPRLDKTTLWLSHFLDSSNKNTYLQRSNSAVAAGYKPGHSAYTMGERNYKKYTDHISRWLDEVGLSENALKTKLLNLLDAQETKFFSDKGIVTDQRDVEALSIQQRALDMAFKVKGTYAPEKIDISGLNALLSALPEQVRAEIVRQVTAKKGVK